MFDPAPQSLKETEDKVAPKTTSVTAERLNELADYIEKHTERPFDMGSWDTCVGAYCKSWMGDRWQPLMGHRDNMRDYLKIDERVAHRITSGSNRWDRSDAVAVIRQLATRY